MPINKITNINENYTIVEGDFDVVIEHAPDQGEAKLNWGDGAVSIHDAETFLLVLGTAIRTAKKIGATIQIDMGEPCPLCSE